jgi:hypothetical protein
MSPALVEAPIHDDKRLNIPTADARDFVDEEQEVSPPGGCTPPSEPAQRVSALFVGNDAVGSLLGWAMRSSPEPGENGRTHVRMLCKERYRMCGRSAALGRERLRSVFLTSTKELFRQRVIGCGQAGTSACRTAGIDGPEKLERLR